MCKVLKKKVGRPTKRMEDAAIQAIDILQIGSAISIGRWAKLRELGFANENSALAAIKKRQRGLVHVSLGDAVKQAHFPPINKTAVALRCVVEDGMPVALVARYFQLDRRNLVRALPRYRKLFQAEAEAIAKVQVSEVNNLLPSNTTPQR